MFKALFAEWKIFGAVAVILVIGALYLMWQKSESDLKVSQSQTSTVTAQKDAVINRNIDQINDLSEINKDAANTVTVQKKAASHIEKFSKAVNGFSDKLGDIKGELNNQLEATVDGTKYLSPESVKVLQKLVSTVEPMVYPDDKSVDLTTPSVEHDDTHIGVTL